MQVDHLTIAPGLPFILLSLALAVGSLVSTRASRHLQKASPPDTSNCRYNRVAKMLVLFFILSRVFLHSFFFNGRFKEI